MSPFPPSAATDPNLPHDSLVSHINGICSAMLVLVTLVVAARFWIRIKLVKCRAGADDWCILVAWVLAVTHNLTPLIQTKFGLGKHVYDLPPDANFSASLELYYFGELLYYVCVAVTKIAILSLYLRIAIQRTYRRLIWACMAFVIASTTACVTVSIFQCKPIHKAWDFAGTVPGSCIDVTALFFANAGLDIFQDALIYVLPMRMIYQLQVPKRQKIALMMVFAVGGFVVITGMIRLNYLKVVQNTPDLSYNNYGGAVWSNIETNIGLVCASLPAFKPLIDRFFPSLMGYSHSGPSKTVPPGTTVVGKRGYIRKTSQSEFQLGSSAAWKDSSRSNHGGDVDYNSRATAEGRPPLRATSNDENLRSVNPHGKDSGIWKSTSVVVSHDGL